MDSLLDTFHAPSRSHEVGLYTMARHIRPSQCAEGLDPGICRSTLGRLLFANLALKLLPLGLAHAEQRERLEIYPASHPGRGQRRG
jgi:hypothetical protein